jgi:CheY-like chemotaxis protein
VSQSCIVVVDDEADLRVLVTQILTEEGYRVLAYGHPVPVTQLHTSEEQPQLFLIDVMLPDMDGIALARRLHYTRFAATPKIAMSASAQALSHAGESNQFAALLSKPFDLDDLLAHVEQHVLS